MPLYPFINEETGESFEEFMSYDDMKEKTKEGSPFRIDYSQMGGNIGYSMESFVNKRLPQDYRNKLSKIKKENKGSTVNDR